MSDGDELAVWQSPMPVVLVYVRVKGRWKLVRREPLKQHDPGPGTYVPRSGSVSPA